MFRDLSKELAKRASAVIDKSRAHFEMGARFDCRLQIAQSSIMRATTSLILLRLDYENATLAGIPLYKLKRLQSMINSAALLVFPSSRYNHITPLLHELHWLKAAEKTDYMSSFVVYKCRLGAAPSHLAELRDVSRRISRHDVDYVPPRRHR